MTRKQLYTLLAMIIGSGVAVLDGSVVNVALPSISRELHASFSDLQWIVDGYALSLSSLILLGGSLGDIFGHKRIYLTGLSGFGIMSMVCGLSPDANALIVFRVLQGVFGALLVPGALAIINTNFAPNQRGRAIGQWSAWSALVTPIGPLLGGYIVGVATWRWIFFINIPLIIACFILAKAGVTEEKTNRVRHVDVPGVMLGAFGLGATTYGLIEGPAHHWQITAMAACIVGVASLIAFVFAEQRRKDPMVDLRLFRSRNFSGANIATFTMYGALGGLVFSLIIFLQTTVGYSAVKAGASMLPVSILLLTLSTRMGALASKYGARRFMTVGPLLAAAGIAMLYRLHHGSTYILDIFPGVLLFSLGIAINVAPLTMTVMSSVTDRSSGIASGINNAVARVAGLLVVAVLGIFGVSHQYKFAIILCTVLAAFAGVCSWATIRSGQITEV